MADRDAAGARIALQTRSLLLGVGLEEEQVRVVQAAAGKDASDHLAAGYAADGFVPADLATLTALAATAPTLRLGRGYSAGRAA